MQDRNGKKLIQAVFWEYLKICQLTVFYLKCQMFELDILMNNNRTERTIRYNKPIINYNFVTIYYLYDPIFLYVIICNIILLCLYTALSYTCFSCTYVRMYRH